MRIAQQKESPQQSKHVDQWHTSFRILWEDSKAPCRMQEPEVSKNFMKKHFLCFLPVPHNKKISLTFHYNKTHYSHSCASIRPCLASRQVWRKTRNPYRSRIGVRDDKT